MESSSKFNFNDIKLLRDNLLDISLRNNLLNFKPLKRSIEIIDEDIVSLYTLIVLKETKMKFYSNENLEIESENEPKYDKSNLDEYFKINPINVNDNTWVSNAEIKEHHLDNYLQTDYDKDLLKTKLNSLYRENKTNLEEQGYNNLFLALGFLEWKEDGNSNIFHSAPLILVPMTIEKESVSSPFVVYWTGDEIRSNLSLIYKLKEQDIEIDMFDELESGEDLVNYLKSIEKSIKNKKDWRITKDIYLSNFSFKKFVMFNDLDLKNWNNINHSCVNGLFGSNVDFEDSQHDGDYDFDSINSIERHNVLDADSSQLEVLEEIIKGKNLVVEGPPGTGKSQTIVNIIAELMAMNKKVLFVSEKKAALDVVKARLDDLGLGEGCLELHGKNSNKKEVLKELQNTLGLEYVKLNNDNNFQELDDLKNELNEYSNTLHSIYGDTELSIFDLIGYFIKNKEILEKNEQLLLDINLTNASSFTPEIRGDYVKKINKLKSSYELIKPISENPWRETSPHNISTFEVKEIESNLNELINKFNEFEEISDYIHDLTGVEEFDSLDIEGKIYKLNILNCNSKLIKQTDKLDELIDDIEIFQEKMHNIDFDVFNLNLNHLNNEINELWEEIQSLDIDFNIIDNEDLEYLNEEINIKNQFIESSNFKELLNDSDLKQKLDDFKTKKEFIESSNFKELLNDSDLKQKLDDFKTKKEFIESSNFKELLNDSDLKQKLDDFKTKKEFMENSNLKEKLQDNHLKSKLNNFKNKKEFIDNSNLKPMLDDSELKSKLNFFKTKKDSFFKKTFNKDYKNLKKEFSSYYSIETNDNKIVKDLEELVQVNEEFGIIKKEFSRYYPLEVSDENIITDLEELIKTNVFYKNLKKEFSSYYSFTSITDDQIIKDLEELIQVNEEYESMKIKFTSYYDNEVSNDQIVKDLEELIQVNEEYESMKIKFTSYYDNEVSSDQIIEDLEELIRTNTELKLSKNKILNYYKKSDLKINEIIDETEVLLSDYSKLNEICLEFRKYNINISPKLTKEKILELIELNNLLNKIISNDDIGSYYFNTEWNSYKSDIAILRDLLLNLKKFCEQYDKGFFNDKTIDLIQSIDFNELNDKITLLMQNKKYIITIYNELNNKLSFNREFNCFDENRFNNNAITKISDYKKYIQNFLTSIDNLANYRLFVKYCEEYKDENTENIIKHIQKDDINSNFFTNIFYYVFARSALKDISSESDVLNDFNYSIHQEKIEKFKKLDKQAIKANIIRVKEILNYNRPNIFSLVAPESSLGILKHEFTKKRKLMPIRKLLSRTYDAISSIKPCFMMSPISIAQFLEPSTFESYFDYVIFDEASQVKIEDSIGAFFRAKNYVVMGDTKQLPPTTFFEKDLDIDEIEEDNYVDDVESILHLCKNTTETKMLKWHYRSRHESLINVSNNEFYDNKLYVFPSPKRYDEDLGLRFEYNSSTEYQRGKGANNIKEAEDLIEYAFRLVEKYGKRRSIGVATFNTKQRDTILDILEKKLRERPDLEDYFLESGKEGFFVKNLENIQGDERDIILISVGYGYDSNGKLTMNFGPLNKSGGERRLNVLITRARMQCVVFANFKSSHMLTNEKTPRGVEALKTFLYYAELGELPKNYHTGDDFDSPFEESVYDFLIDEGYRVEKQVGSSGYKIDLAIVDNENANRYILAIECDGVTYHSSRSARDRDRLRQTVLENLGWKFYRIWSTDWFYQTNDSKRRLIEAIENAIKQKDNEYIAKSIESDFEPEIIVKNNEDLINEQLDKYFEDYQHCFGLKNTYTDEKLLKDLINFEGPIHIDDIYDSVKKIRHTRATITFKESIRACLHNLDSVYCLEDFYYPSNFNFENMKVRRRISPNINRISNEEVEKAIINTLKLEFSSNRSSLIKSASRHLGFKSAGSKIKERFDYIIDYKLMNNYIIEKDGIIELIHK